MKFLFILPLTLVLSACGTPASVFIPGVAAVAAIDTLHGQNISSKEELKESAKRALDARQPVDYSKLNN